MAAIAFQVFRLAKWKKDKIRKYLKKKEKDANKMEILEMENQRKFITKLIREK